MACRRKKSKAYSGYRQRYYADPMTTEARWWAIGVSSARRYVFLAFTLRKIDGQTFIRPISARYMHDKEIRRYEQR